MPLRMGDQKSPPLLRGFWRLLEFLLKSGLVHRCIPIPKTSGWVCGSHLGFGDHVSMNFKFKITNLFLFFGRKIDWIWIIAMVLSVEVSKVAPSDVARALAINTLLGWMRPGRNCMPACEAFENIRVGLDAIVSQWQLEKGENFLLYALKIKIWKIKICKFIF